MATFEDAAPGGTAAALACMCNCGVSKSMTQTCSFRRVLALECCAMHYGWGAVGHDSLVARLAAVSRGEKILAGTPYAELWVGAHHKAPAGDQFAFETAGDIGFFHIGVAFEHACGRDLDQAGTGQGDLDLAFDHQTVAGCDLTGQGNVAADDQAFLVGRRIERPRPVDAPRRGVFFEVGRAPGAHVPKKS